MDADDKKKLDHLIELTEENNKFIKKVRRSQKSAETFRTLYWVIILGVTIAGYYYAQPYLKSVTTFMSEMSTSLKSAGIDFPSFTGTK